MGDTDLIEARLNILDLWLAEDPENDDIIKKRDEYLGLLDELSILQKKLKKTAKLLMQTNNQDRSTSLRLAKKQEQYSNELEEIVSYVESDALFDEAPLEPSELLGEPLETLVEQPGMEGSSQTFNMSVSDLPYMPPRPQRNRSDASAASAAAAMNNLSAAAAAATGGAGGGVLDTSEYEDLQPISEETSQHYSSNNNASIPSLLASMASLNTTEHTFASANNNGHDASTLRKKLRKVERLLQQQDLDDKQKQKLQRKRDEYMAALENFSKGGGGDDTDAISLDKSTGSCFGDKSLASLAEEESIFGDDFDMEDSEGNQLQYLQQKGDNNIGPSPPVPPVVNKTNNNSSNHGTTKTYDENTLKKKIRKVNKLIASTEDPDELDLYRLKQKEYAKALQVLGQQEQQQGNGSAYQNDDTSKPLDPIAPRKSHRDSYDSIDAYEDFDEYDDEDDADGPSSYFLEQDRLLQKKIRKADKLIDEAYEVGDEKQAKKLEAKRKEYVIKLMDLRKPRRRWSWRWSWSSWPKTRSGGYGAGSEVDPRNLLWNYANQLNGNGVANESECSDEGNISLDYVFTEIQSLFGTTSRSKMRALGMHVRYICWILWSSSSRPLPLFCEAQPTILEVVVVVAAMQGTDIAHQPEAKITKTNPLKAHPMMNWLRTGSRTHT